jgi:putative addiction module component (TIGR02574 family)
MTAEDVKALPIDRKLQIMEAIWDDLQDRFERWDVPLQQRRLLDQRRARVREGAVQLLDWDSVKEKIGRS